MAFTNNQRIRNTDEVPESTKVRKVRGRLIFTVIETRVDKRGRAAEYLMGKVKHPRTGRTSWVYLDEFMVVL